MEPSGGGAGSRWTGRAGTGLKSPFVKRALDLAVGSVLLVVATPFMVLGALAVLLEDGGPVMFHQQRAGKNESRFTLHKLRTMRRHDLTVGAVGQVGADHDLLLRAGRWLRRLKIDELPQLLNVLRGNMSLVGPRPTVPEQVAAYSPFERRRLSVKPGMTGWAQVHGNVRLSWPDRILLDVWYVDNWTVGLDLGILGRTAAVMFLGEQVNERALEDARLHAARADRSG
jgi:lipopolysaccharide/colanic/teichoic acid biosynthesis glycosyltransferase